MLIMPKTQQQIKADFKEFSYDRLYMDIALRVAEMSHDEKHRVGCVIVKNGILAEGWNGSPTGFPNETRDSEGNTLSWVIHAEQNAIAKCAQKGVSCKGATLYVTLAPCRDCARLILQSGITKVVYGKRFSDKEGLNLLKTAKLNVYQFIVKED